MTNDTNLKELNKGTFFKYYYYTFPFCMMTATEEALVHVVLLVLLVFVGYWTLFRIPAFMGNYVGLWDNLAAFLN